MVNPSNPPNQVTEATAAIPVWIAAGGIGGAVSQIVPGLNTKVSPSSGLGAVTVGENLTSLTPAALAAGTTDNYAPTSYVAGSTSRLQVTPVATSALGGIVSPAQDGFELDLWNASATVTLELLHESGGSSAGNQFLLQNAVSPQYLLPLSGMTLKWMANPIGTSTGYWTPR